MKNITLGLLSLVLSNASVIAADKFNPNETLQLDVRQITVSGLSSGGFMATQMHVAYADWVSGAGIIAAGPYYCAQNSLPNALQACLNQTNVTIDLEAIEEQRKRWQQQDKVADISAMKNDKVWLLHGQKDQRLSSHVASTLVSQYQTWVKPENLQVVDDKPFAHHLPTLAQGSECDQSQPPFLGQCQYDAAGELLSHILSDVKAPSEEAKGQVVAFNQHDIAGDAGGSLAEIGYLYVPQECAAGASCQVHISFHGCNQFADAPNVDNQYVTGGGFNRWADTNRLVVLYPQTQASNLSPFNPQGCWDWWGYSGSDYANRDGLQLQAVVNMVEHLAGEHDDK